MIEDNIQEGPMENDDFIRDDQEEYETTKAKELLPPVNELFTEEAMEARARWEEGGRGDNEK